MTLLPQTAAGRLHSNQCGGASTTVNIGRTQSAVGCARPGPLIIDRRSSNTMVSAKAPATGCWSRTSPRVTVWDKPRLRHRRLDHDDYIVQGIVLVRRGEQSSPTIARVEQLWTSISNSSILPPGVRIEPSTTAGTERHPYPYGAAHMVVGILLTFCLGNGSSSRLRSALIVGATILSGSRCFSAVIILVLRGEFRHSLSVGAIVAV